MLQTPTSLKPRCQYYYSADWLNKIIEKSILCCLGLAPVCDSAHAYHDPTVYSVVTSIVLTSSKR